MGRGNAIIERTDRSLTARDAPAAHHQQISHIIKLRCSVVFIALSGGHRRAKIMDVTDIDRYMHKETEYSWEKLLIIGFTILALAGVVMFAKDATPHLQDWAHALL